MAESDRRHFPRQSKETTIQILLAPDHSNSRNDSYDLLPANMRNQSEEGLYIEIDHALQPGSTLSIKMAAPAQDHPEDIYYNYDGQVVWCKKVDEKTARFGGGIKITRKVIRADILTSRF